MKIALLGYGKMGKTIERLAVAKGHIVVYKSDKAHEEGELKDAQVAIEFSTPQAAAQNISRCFELNIPVVSGTTGWLEDFDNILKKRESCNGSFIYASNFSVGVNLFFKLNEYLARLMKPWPQYDVTIEEIHHTEKKDAPSGTAISIAEGILKHSEKEGWELNSVDPKKINISAKRLDDVKGTHLIDYSSEIDSIRIEHVAHSRDGFALGALLAAEWLIGKNGVYSMQDVLGLNE
jgi:4-hydroxy-tetrahydrodipicolinate reductase